MGKRATRKSPKRSKPSSVLGSLLLELVAIAGFFCLMSAANANREANAVEQPSGYGSVLQGYVSDQWVRFGPLRR